MADKITNFEDYKKKTVDEPVEKADSINEETPVKKEEPVKKPDLSETTVINRIEIEDPYNFFTEEEREAYFRERQKAEKNERRESAPKKPEQERVERPVRPERQERPARPEAQGATSEVKRVEKEPEKPIRTRRENPRRDRREDYYEDDVRDERYEDDIRGRDYDYYEDDYDYDRDYDEEYDEDDYDESEDKMMRIVVRIASIMTGIVILTLIIVVLKASVFDRVFHKDPEEQVTEESQDTPGEEQQPQSFEIPAGYTQVDDTVTVINNDVNLRNKPKNEAGSEVIAVAKVGTQLKRVATDGVYWAIVEYEGQYLYASMNYLSTP
ncbi:MAG: hypothetical protein IKO84_03390 [Butyrivibrio sp.]|nr:hypothetical protein [Butyrivibrio sp.]